MHKNKIINKLNISNKRRVGLDQYLRLLDHAETGNAADVDRMQNLYWDGKR